MVYYVKCQWWIESRVYYVKCQRLIGVSYISIWLLILEKKPFQFWQGHLKSGLSYLTTTVLSYRNMSISVPLNFLPLQALGSEYLLSCFSLIFVHCPLCLFEKHKHFHRTNFGSPNKKLNIQTECMHYIDDLWLVCQGRVGNDSLYFWALFGCK